MWPGATVAILASGPSMSQATADEVRQAGLPAIAINTTHRLAPWADMLYAADAEWWAHADNADARRFAGLRVTAGTGAPGVLRLRNTGAEGFDPDPGAVRTGSNSTYQALHIAMHAGATRVLLLGVDMHGDHWHGKHPAGLRNTPPEHFALFIRRFASIRPAAERMGCDIVNCTPGSALQAFRFSTLAAEVQACAAL
jgi:hypothetical protein